MVEALTRLGRSFLCNSRNESGNSRLAGNPEVTARTDNLKKFCPDA